MTEIGHNSVSKDQLKSIIERVERLEEDKRAISDDIKDVYGEAKARGFDAKIMKQVIKLRAQEPHDRQETRAILDTYCAALGINF